MFEAFSNFLTFLTVFFINIKIFEKKDKLLKTAVHFFFHKKKLN